MQTTPYFALVWSFFKSHCMIILQVIETIFAVYEVTQDMQTPTDSRKVAHPAEFFDFNVKLQYSISG